MSRLLSFSLSIVLLCLIGCGVEEKTENASEDSSLPEVISENQVQKEASPPEKQLPEKTEPIPEKPKPQEAKVGVGKKGRNYGGGVITEPASQYWKTKERIAFDVQIPSALKLFKTLNGNAPKSHDEFMEKIIEVGRIKLPALPPGRRYVYDPKLEKLMVERQKP